MSQASDIADLETTRSNLITLLKEETAAQITGGPKPSYSLDGVSYQWNEWREAVLRKVEHITKLINMIGSPWIVRSRGRA